MANNQEQFDLFHDTINSTKRETLRKNRDAIRTRITNYFNNNLPDEIKPIFRGQGSFAMYTILNPIKDDSGLGAYDLDDGVVFQSDTIDDRKSESWYHDKIVAAVTGHTDQDPIDKGPCVRVTYADGHHIDLPIYFELEGSEHPQLAHKYNGWVDSDPQEFTQWFSDQCGEKPMLRRLVRYLKAWCEYISSEKGFKMPSGCSLTMLAAKHYVDNEDKREDIALSKMLASMYDSLSVENGFKCPRPTFPEGEDLFKEYSETRKNNFLNELKSFKNDAERALNCKNQKEACEKWQKHFGPRFSCSTAKDEDEDARQKSFSGSVRNNSQFA